MMKRSWSCLLVLCLVALPVFASAQNAAEVTEGDLKVDHGQVNWTERTIVATGSGAPDLKAANVAVARLGAERVAKLDALRNIMEALKGVRVSSEVTVENEMVTNSKMRTKVEGVARRFKVTRTKYYSDGGVDLVVQMSLDGPLASTLVKTGEAPKAAEAPNSGVIIDARGLKAMPALAPRLLDEGGGVLYSSEALSKESLEANGVVGYFKDFDAAKKNERVGAKPLTVKALKLADDSKTDVVLSNVDAEKLKAAGGTPKYLTQGHVIIVID